MPNEGWIKLFRQIQSHPRWTRERFDRARAWIDLVLSAAHKAYRAIRSDTVIPVKRGQLLTTQVGLANRWKWDRKTVRRFLVGLERDQMVVVERAIRGDIGYTLITITNYGLYQNKELAGAHSNAHSSPHSVPIQSPFSPHDQECKEGKEGEETPLPATAGTTDELAKESIPDGVHWKDGIQISNDWRTYLSGYLQRYSEALDTASGTILGTRLSVEEAQGVIEYINERLLNDSRLRATEKSKPPKWKQFRAFIRNQFVRALIQKRQRERDRKSRQTPRSPDAMGITGEHQATDYTVEIAACVEKHGPDVHAVENLKDSGPRGQARWCKFKCGYSERKRVLGSK